MFISGSGMNTKNAKFHNQLIGAGLGLLVVGIALSCINQRVAQLVGGIFITFGTSVLFMGGMMTCIRKSNEPETPAGQIQQPLRQAAHPDPKNVDPAVQDAVRAHWAPPPGTP